MDVTKKKQFICLLRCSPHQCVSKNCIYPYHKAEMTKLAALPHPSSFVGQLIVAFAVDFLNGLLVKATLFLGHVFFVGGIPKQLFFMVNIMIVDGPYGNRHPTKSAKSSRSSIFFNDSGHFRTQFWLLGIEASASSSAVEVVVVVVVTRLLVSLESSKRSVQPLGPVPFLSVVFLTGKRNSCH